MRARGQVRKASRVPPHAYCRALLIGPDPGGMKYKNRNKAPLPVPGEMLRYRIRDSGALLPARANKRTPAPPGIIGARCPCPFFLLPPLYRMSPFPSSLPPDPPPTPRLTGGLEAEGLRGQGRARLQPLASCPRLFHSRWTFRDYRRKGRLYSVIRSLQTSRQCSTTCDTMRAVRHAGKKDLVGSTE